MSYRPGQHGTRLEAEQRAKRLLEKTTLEGKKVTAAAAEENVSRQTATADLGRLTKRYVEQNNDALVEIKQKVAEEYLNKANDVLAGRVDPDVMNAWSRVMRDFKNLLGLDAVKTAIVGHVSANPEHSREYLFFREACAGLSEDQLNTVYDFARAIERVPVITVKDASWFPAPMNLQLEDGDPDETV